MNKKRLTLTYSIFSLTCLLLCGWQAMSLATVPMLDSWGDESWLMIEFHEQLFSGILRHPYAYGSTIHLSNGFVFGSDWMTAIIYGGTWSLFSFADPVILGRVLSSIICVVAVGIFLWIAIKDYRIGAIAIALFSMIASRSFLFAAHSARYDAITALYVFCVFLTTIYYKRMGRRNVISLGVLFGASLIITAHASLILLPLGIWTIVEILKQNGLRAAGIFFLSVVSVLTICLGVYALTGGNFGIFGGSGASGFQSNLEQIPILHLLTPRTILVTIVQKYGVVRDYAPALGLLFLLSAVIAVLPRYRNRDSRLRTGVLLVVVGYVLFEGAQSYYLVYILPVLGWFVMDSMERAANNSRFMNSALIVIAVVIAGIGTAEDLNMNRAGKLLHEGSRHVEAELQRFLDSVANGQPVRMLVAPQSVHRIVGWQNVDLMTTQFLDFPLDVYHPFAAVATHHVRYVEILASGPAWWYSPESVRLREYAKQHGKIVFCAFDYFLEAGRRYEAPLTAPADTLLIYELQTRSDSAATNVKSVYLHSISLRTNRLDQKEERQ